MTQAVSVLVVEDEELIQEIVNEALEDGGFDVVRAMTGEEAVAKLEAADADYRALVTDIRLGRSALLGWDVAKRAREIHPEMPVVYISGDSGHDWSANGVPGSLMITKPFAPAQLVTAVAQLINERAAAPSGNDPET